MWRRIKSGECDEKQKGESKSRSLVGHKAASLGMTNLRLKWRVR
jgi:hypothetical protein